MKHLVVLVALVLVVSTTNAFAYRAVSQSAFDHIANPPKASAATPAPILVPGDRSRRQTELDRENAKTNRALYFDPREFQAKPREDQPVTILRGK